MFSFLFHFLLIENVIIIQLYVFLFTPLIQLKFHTLPQILTENLVGRLGIILIPEIAIAKIETYYTFIFTF